MNLAKLEAAVREAYRFLDAAKDARGRIPQEDYQECYGDKFTAAAKRASMDLTRALAELGKS